MQTGKKINEKNGRSTFTIEALFNLKICFVTDNLQTERTWPIERYGSAFIFCSACIDLFYEPIG